MNRSVLHRSVSCLGVIIVLTTGHVTAAQDALATARDLYRAAEYDDALKLLDGLRASNRRPDEGRAIDEYRAYCLLALGRRAEAEHAIEAVVSGSPSYRPSAEEASPGVRSMFGTVRPRS